MLDNLNLPKKRIMIRDAGILRRLISLILDILILNLIIATPFEKELSSYFGKSFKENLLLSQSGIPATLYFIIILLVALAIVYFTLMQYYFRQTLGMMLTRIHASGNINLWTSFLRSIFLIPFFPFFLLWIVEPIFLIWKKMTFLEMITSTKTIELFEM